MSLFKLIADGGFVMYPLLICSIIIWALVIDKWWMIRNLQRSMDSLFERISLLLKEGKLHEARGLGRSAPRLLVKPFLVLLEGNKSNKDAWHERIERRLVETKNGAKRNVWILGTIGASSPFIGLFGTVVGIIKSFESIAKAGKSGFAVVAAGLSEALIATAAGIIVAVVAVIFYNYFQNRLNQFSSDFKLKIADLMDLLQE